MTTIKVKTWAEVPQNYTGIVEWDDGIKEWYKNGEYHREDGPARIYKEGFNSWWLDEKFIWHSNRTPLDLTNQIIFSKVQHPDYPTVQIWKILGPNGLYEQVIIPGMEELIIE